MRTVFIKKIIACCCICAFLLTSCGASKTASKAGEKYDELRERFALEDIYKTSAVLDEKEQLADKKLEELKKQFSDSYNGDVPYDMPFLSESKIWSSPLYAFFDALPKGSDLHVHASAVLPAKEMIDFVKSRNDLRVGIGKDNRYKLIYTGVAETGADTVPLKDAVEKGILTEDELLENWTVLGAADDGDIWMWFESLFNDFMDITASPDIIEAYYYDAFSYLCEHNIMHTELRCVFFGTNDETRAYAEAVRSAYYRVRAEHPQFVASILGCGLKYLALDKSINDTLIPNALYVYENVKDEYDSENVHDFLIGIDLVNEEDESYPLSEYRDMLQGIKDKYPDLKIILHAGESVCADAENNALDAYLFGAERIGHGLNIYRYPKLLNALISNDVCIEVCPVSNQTLRFVEDLRSHPAVEYLKRGVAVVLASDDPAFQEHTVLTDDFFAAAVCWDLGLAEIKQLCINSIRHCGVDETTKTQMMKNWEAQWDVFINSVI
ncbi:MAG: hypothetical protein IKR93_07040 [Firmicutes bacterium]|nr:hypothetical protein [Bacillota bacterium]